jgi:beta-lactamase superfamily II metal-dependent hydrolase
MRARIFFIAIIILFITYTSNAQILEVIKDKNAIVKMAPNGDSEQFPDRLPGGTRVEKVGESSRYYSIRLSDGKVGWSYKGNFIVVEETNHITQTSAAISKESLLARTDVLKIINIDVEVGDATLIICPAENGERDVILIDTGENDSDRINKELINNGFVLSSQPISRFYITHYDTDHCGDAVNIIPLAKIIYDHGNNNIKSDYKKAVSKPGVDRRLMKLDYQETFSGGVNVECVAVNQGTDFDPDVQPSKDNDNQNSIGLIISYDNFDFFIAGDLEENSEKFLAKGIKNCDVYHVSHHGSSTTSSALEFVTKLDPEVSIASNGTKYGHPSKSTALRLINDVGSKFYQTNVNPDVRAYQPDLKYTADDTYFKDKKLEEQEGSKGDIIIEVDPLVEKYYVIMEGLSLDEATFQIE